MNRRWKIGLVGVGRGSGYGRLFAADPRCQIAACCDTSSDALARFQKELELPDDRCFTEYADLLGAELDAVFIGTPIPVHAEQSVAALEAGVDVLCEVTAASTLEGCRRVVEAARRTGRIYMLAENCVYWPFVQDWKRRVRDGQIGEVFYAECEYLHPIPHLIVDPETGQRRWRAERAPLHYCSHSLGPILEIMGDRITRAMGLGDGHRVLPEGGTGGIDIQVALFQTERDAIIKLLRTSVAPRPALHFYLVQGTRGVLESDRCRTGGTGRLYIEGEMDAAQPLPCPLADESLPPEARQGGHGTAEYGVVQEFLDALATRRRPSLDAVRGMEICAPGLVAHESAMQGGVWLDVPSFR